MQLTQRLMAMATACLLFFASCKKDHVDPIPPHDESTVTEVGLPDGTPVRKNIGPAGGQINSADGTVSIIIPAGALAADKQVSIQPITNKLPSGIGKAYRLTPHGEQFAKPVSIVFNYKAEDLSNTIPEFIDIAFQDAQGTWQAVMGSTVDKNTKKITVSTTHFSDWTRFKSMTLTPRQATVELGGSVDLQLRTTFPYVDPDDDPNKMYKPVYTSPRELRPDEVKGWSYQGDGILISRGSNAYYTAPGHEPSTNPEAVSVNINLHRKGQFMLVSNITVLAGHGVKYLQVDEDTKSPLNNGKCMLYIWGSFGNDPGAAKRSVTVNGTTVPVNLWSPGIIRCAIDEYISGPIEIISNGKTVARSVLRKFTGKFVYTRYHGGVSNAGSTNPLKESTEFELVYRGFGSPCPADVNKLFEIEGSLAALTMAKYTIGGSASVTTPPRNGCTMTSSVSVPTTSDLYFLEPQSMGGLDGFSATSIETASGIDVKLDYALNDVVSGVIVQRSYSCGSSSSDHPRILGVSLEGFNNKTISLEFTGVDGMKLKGTNELKSNRMSSGILIEAWDGTGSPSHYETDGLMQATFKNK
jgi:hypothetical protein